VILVDGGGANTVVSGILDGGAVVDARRISGPGQDFHALSRPATALMQCTKTLQ
jgi:hypothetical protein